jgi:hypothetical protein
VGATLEVRHAVITVIASNRSTIFICMIAYLSCKIIKNENTAAEISGSRIPTEIFLRQTV